jgi:hypothetical protein
MRAQRCKESVSSESLLSDPVGRRKNVLKVHGLAEDKQHGHDDPRWVDFNFRGCPHSERLRKKERCMVSPARWVKDLTRRGRQLRSRR